MKFLLDQGLPRSTVAELHHAGFEAEHVGDLGLARAPDELILRQALERDAVVLTLDADFHRLLALSGDTAPSVIRLRAQGLLPAEIARLCRQIHTHAHHDLVRGAVVSCDRTAFRLHRLPIGRR